MVGRRSRWWPWWLLCALGAWGCSAGPSRPEEPLGKLPDAVTSAVPEWIPFRIRAGRSVEADRRERRLRWMRQLTDDGRSSAAAWHPSGRAIVFERRSADGCAQLFMLDLATGDARRVSPEAGSALRAAFGAEDALLFAYAPEGCARAADDGQPPLPLLRWSLPPSDIWSLAGTAPQAPQTLIADPAFDGEPSTAADGSFVFTSTRSGDPELYVAAADGSAVTRVTEAPGYDGHARFSPDGSSLVWHGEHAKPRGKRGAPRALRLYLAGNRGQHPRELPSLGSYDITPAFLPDARRVLFASDYDADPAEGGTGYELYLFDPSDPPSADGRPITERVTYAMGFDGEPVFSPDGAWLLFTSSRRSDGTAGPPGETNVFVAQWIEP